MKTTISFLMAIILLQCTVFAQLNSNQLALTVKMNKLSDETILRFDSNGTYDFNPQEDAYKFMNSKNSPSFYTVMNNIQYSIKTLPTNFKQTAVPLQLAAPAAGNYTITAYQVHPFDSLISITFVDSLNGTTQDLKTQPTYSFTLSGRDTLLNRFYIVFTKPQPVIINTPSDTATTAKADTITTATSDTATVSITDTIQAPIVTLVPDTTAPVLSLGTPAVPADTATVSITDTITTPSTPVIPVSDTISLIPDTSSANQTQPLSGTLPSYNKVITSDSVTTVTVDTTALTPHTASVTAVVPTAQNGNDVKIYGYGDQVTIANGNTYSIDGSIIIYNMQGQVLLEQQSVHVANNTDYKISMNGVSNDVYIVSLATTGTTVSQRVLLGN